MRNKRQSVTAFVLDAVIFLSIMMIGLITFVLSGLPIALSPALAVSFLGCVSFGVFVVMMIDDLYLTPERLTLFYELYKAIKTKNWW